MNHRGGAFTAQCSVAISLAVLLILVSGAACFGAAKAVAPSKHILSGLVLSGSKPIAGADVTLYGSVGRCMPDPCSIVSVPVEKSTTDARGRFSMDLSKAHAAASVMGGPPGPRIRAITAAPERGTLYLIASGGNAGKGTNRAIKLVLLLGTPPPQGHVVIDELTTAIALLSIRPTAWFPAQLASDTYALFHDFIDPVNGHLRPLLSRGANSPALANSLADILHACVSSAGPDSAECAFLFRATSPIAFERKVTNTLLAMQSIVLHPDRNSRTLFDLIGKTPPYRPVLTAPPAGWLLTLNFTGGGMSRPTSIVADRYHKTLWIIDRGNRSLTELSSDPSSLGSPMGHPNGVRIRGLRRPSALCLQPGIGFPIPEFGSQPERLWVTDKAGNALTVIMPEEGGVFSSKRILAKGLAGPVGVIVYPSNPPIYRKGNRWILYSGIAVTNSEADRVNFFKLDGTACGPPLEGLGLKSPLGLDLYGSVILIANSGAGELLAIKPPNVNCNGARLVQRIRGDALSSPQYIADGWVTNRSNGSVASLETSGSMGPYRVNAVAARGGGLAEPEGIAGGGYGVWVVNHAPRANSITRLAGRSVQAIYGNTEPWTALSPSEGFRGAGMSRPYGIAIDSLGDIWVTNEGDDSVTMFVRAARRPM
jgi:hypothetical protein